MTTMMLDPWHEAPVGLGTKLSLRDHVGEPQRRISMRPNHH